ncbi:DUF6782 family putative metallopeptidase [Tropicibacter oceani]|uniref:DUF6782 domain-containing protein n=1 Tax=Tropicibacter oceani TaxID=3058420 RepID=A0ABY8QNL5_9RHOB|nr:DUF6782 family putative metallopeptidase [Tropicibacter oceani]WGW05412.1 hypothetical protein QF118_07660 [Tropicibacter oceani]
MRTRLATTLALLFCPLAPLSAEPLRCAPPPFDDLPELQGTLTALAPAMQAFPTLQTALETRVREICISSQLRDAQGYFEPETRRLVLSDGLSPGLQQAVLIHELRHAQQFGMGSCPSLDLAMTDYAQAVFAMEADASVASLVVARYLLDNGQPRMWEALIAWPLQGDIAQVFQQAWTRHADLGAAAAQAFDAWFDNPARLQTYYVASCMDYLDQTERDHLLPQYQHLSPAFYDQLCRLPDGRAYACAAPEKDGFFD